MNFLLRSSQTVAPEQPSVHENNKSLHHPSKSVTTLEGLIAEDPYPRYDATERQTDDIRSEDGRVASSSSNVGIPTVEKHCDVSEEEGWITIPCKELPDKWNEAPDIHSLRSLDRSFVFPGEQVHILACLSACEQDVEIITPFKVAAVMSKNGIGKSPEKENGDVIDGKDSVSESSVNHPGGHDVDQNGQNPSQEKTDPHKDISAGESLLRMEDQKRKIEKLLQKFKTSHFFVRITEEGDILWSRKGATETLSDSSDAEDPNHATNESSKDVKSLSQFNAIIDKGNFNANVFGGVARNMVQCFALANGDIVVLLQVNVGVGLLKDPVIEVLQFEKFWVENSSFKNQDNVLYGNEDPFGELLTWLLPLDNTLPPLSRPLSPPQLSSSGIGSTSQRSNFSASSGSQLFSFGNFRSYSMSSIPQSTTPPTSQAAAPSPSPKPNFELEDWDRFSSNKIAKSKKAGKEGLLSFRGVSLEPDRFSVRCGLEGIYIPGRRWRKKLEIIQPIEIHSFAADCNTDDILCVQIKNVSPAHIPDIVVYIDAITIVLEEAAKGGPPLSLPIASIESGENYSLPNLCLRRGEEHSFILKPAISTWKKFSAIERNVSQSSLAKNASSLRISSKVVEGKKDAQSSDRYAVMVSCHCNYTESRLFFKQPTTWRPRISRDIMISVASEMSRESTAPSSVVSQLPVQVLTLHASNLTSEDLTMTVLAPASFTSPPSVVSLNSSPSSPISPFLGIPEVTGKIHSNALGNSIQLASDNQKKNGSGETNEQSSPVSDVISSTGLGCTHLWLKSRVPLGCVPAQTTATIKIELLPLTDGIITLDTLQIDVKEKGLTYIPEHSLKINATSSISTGIM